MFLTFQVKESHDFYEADELSAFQFKVMMWAISLHYFQLQYVLSVHVNAYQQNMKRTKPSNLYNGFEWDGSFHIMDEHTKWLKITLEHRDTQYVNITCTLKQIYWREANPFHYTKSALSICSY